MPSAAHMKPVPGGKTHATSAKQGRNCNWCQARENMQPMSQKEKPATIAKQEKHCNRFQARENM